MNFDWAFFASQFSDPWVIFGFAGQAMFSMRFIVQWLVSEKRGECVIPEIFWYFSLAGGMALFVYAVKQHDPVFMLGQGIGLFVYLRNIYFIWRKKLATA
jgi:lipid-A-disaccharide synthase-like uncharacterized protein